MWNVDDRVRVSNQNSQYRNHLGTVVDVDGTDVYVRIDGHESTGSVLFDEGDLQASTLASPIMY